MIVTAILKVIVTVLVWLLGLFPAFTLPDWFGGLVATIQSGVAPVLELGHWIPLSAMGQVAGITLTIFATTFLIRALRICISWFTGGGGSAA